MAAPGRSVQFALDTGSRSQDVETRSGSHFSMHQDSNGTETDHGIPIRRGRQHRNRRRRSEHQHSSDVNFGPDQEHLANDLNEDRCEIFCGKLPKIIGEPEIRNLFAEFGPLTSVRLIMSPVPIRDNQGGMHYHNKGYAFIEFEHKADAERAIQELNGFEIRRNRHINVDYAKPNLRIFVGNIPKLKGKEELFEEFAYRTGGLKDVIIYGNNEDPELQNRGFCFLEYNSRREANAAKFNLTYVSTKIWGCDIIVDWADPVLEPKPEEMEKVMVLFVRSLGPAVTEEDLLQLFEPFGFIERVKKIKDYAFVHFDSRENAANALESLSGDTTLQETPISVQWSKPPVDKHMREKILQNREKRMNLVLAQREENQANNGYGRADLGVNPPPMLENSFQQQPREFGDYNPWESTEEVDYYNNSNARQSAWNIPLQQRGRHAWQNSGQQSGDSGDVPVPWFGNPNPSGLPVSPYHDGSNNSFGYEPAPFVNYATNRGATQPQSNYTPHAQEDFPRISSAYGYNASDFSSGAGAGTHPHRRRY